MKKEDFVFVRMDEPYEDYWFQVTGDSKAYLTDRYREMCMIEVTDVVYSAKQDFVGVKQLFPFNSYVAASDDEELKSILVSIVAEMKEEN